ncbi:type II secretion system GspH family protein [bacterium]|nr:type II secretion system GspH family protein [bacterium]
MKNKAKPCDEFSTTYVVHGTHLRSDSAHGLSSSLLTKLLKKRGGQTVTKDSPLTKKTAGFSLVEVLGAMMILSIALVALMENQSSSLHLTKKSLLLDQATSLAQGKMAELTVEANRRSLSEFPDSGEGTFEDEALQRFSWRYQTQPVEAPDFAAMAKVAMGEEGASTGEGSAGLLDGPLKSVTEAWSKALLELRVEILWKEGNSEKNYAVVTHLIDEQASSNIAGMVKGMSQALGGGNNEEGGFQ